MEEELHTNAPVQQEFITNWMFRASFLGGDNNELLERYREYVNHPEDAPDE